MRPFLCRALLHAPPKDFDLTWIQLRHAREKYALLPIARPETAHTMIKIVAVAAKKNPGVYLICTRQTPGGLTPFGRG